MPGRPPLPGVHGAMPETPPALAWLQIARSNWRATFQSAAAAAVAFGLTYGLGLPHHSWAVLTALFAVQDSVGATIKTAGLRIAGAVLGTCLALAFLVIG